MEERGNAIACGLHYKISFVTIPKFALFSFKDLIAEVMSSVLKSRLRVVVLFFIY